MEFVKNFTPSDFQEKILHCQFHLKFTLPPALTALTNSTSALREITNSSAPDVNLEHLFEVGDFWALL